MTTTIKTRFMAILLALVCVIGLAPMTVAHAATAGSSGYVMSAQALTVYENEACTQSKGTIFAYEGFTVLDVKNVTGVGTVYRVNYSTSKSGSGYPGYVKNPNLYVNDLSTTCAGTVNSSVTVYGGPQIATQLKLGSLSAGETVAVLNSESGWYYVEYNTTAGRKRGYVQAAYINADYPSVLRGFMQTTNQHNAWPLTANGTVYGGPSERYAPIGSLNSSGEAVTVYRTYQYGADSFFYIGYKVNNTGLVKFGYILARDF